MMTRRIGFMVACLALGLAGLAHAGLPERSPAPATPALKIPPMRFADKIPTLRAKPGAVSRPAPPTELAPVRTPEPGTPLAKVPPILTNAQRTVELQKRGIAAVLPPDDSPDSVTLTPRQIYANGVGLNLLPTFNARNTVFTGDPRPDWPYGQLIHSNFFIGLDIEAHAGSRYLVDLGLTTWECLKSSTCTPTLESYELVTLSSTSTVKVAASPDMHVLALVEVDADGRVELWFRRLGKDNDVLVRSINVARVDKP
jgi:hypothetical protein